MPQDDGGDGVAAEDRDGFGDEGDGEEGDEDEDPSLPTSLGSLAGAIFKVRDEA